MSATNAARRLTLAAALAATVAAAGWVGSQEESAESETQAAARPQQHAVAPAARAATDDIDIEKLQQRVMNDEFGDMFPRRSWQPPPPPPAARKRAPPPAPPLPFTFFGRMVEEGRTVVFLSRQNQSFAVRAGDTIDKVYRVEEIGAATMVLTYLPLGQRQTLQIGTIN